VDLQAYRESLKRFGAPRTLLHGAYRLASRGGRIGVWHGLVIGPEEVLPDDAAHEGGRWMEGEAMSPYTSDPDNGLDARFVSAAARRGDRCHVVTSGGRLASYGWYTTRSPVPVPEVDAHAELHFDPTFAYLYASFTRPEFRGRHLNVAGMRSALAGLVRVGRRGVLAYVELTNHPSLRAFHRVGASCFGHLVVARFGERWLARSSSGCDRYQFQVRHA
jgi:hypothetical protein